MITLEQVKEMKPKEICYHNIKDLTQEAFNYVNEQYELNSCDKCESIESTYDLIWVDYLEEDELETLTEDIKKYTSVCIGCYNGLKK